MEPVEPVLMNIYQIDTYRKDLSWLHFSDEPRVQDRQQVKHQHTCISIFVAYPTIPSQGCIQMFFGHTVFLKLRIGQFSDTQKPPMFVAECLLILNAFGKEYFCLLKRFLFLSIHRLYFI